MERKKIVKGFEIHRGLDGHWLCFDSGKKRGMVNVESKLLGICRDAVIGWIDKNISDTKPTEFDVAREKIKKADNAFLCIIGTIMEREGMTDIEDMCYEAIDMLRGNDQERW